MQKARFLDKEKVIEKLSRLAEKAMARNRNIKKIILFGSLTDNTFTTMSDADLLIVLSESDFRFMDRIPELLYYFLDAPVPVDIFPYTEGEIENITLAKKAISKGIILCEA